MGMYAVYIAHEKRKMFTVYLMSCAIFAPFPFWLLDCIYVFKLNMFVSNIKFLKNKLKMALTLPPPH